MLLPCKSETKQKRYKNRNYNGRRVVLPTPPFFDPLYLFSVTSDFYFESRFVILSLSSTKLDDGVHTVFLAPPPPPPPPPPRYYHKLKWDATRMAGHSSSTCKGIFWGRLTFIYNAWILNPTSDFNAIKIDLGALPRNRINSNGPLKRFQKGKAHGYYGSGVINKCLALSHRPQYISLNS